MNKIAESKARELIRLDSWNNPAKAIVTNKKLTDFYNSRTTNYAHCLNNPPFIIIRDKAIIIEASYSPLCKAIITLDETAPEVIELCKSMLEKRKQEITRDIENEAKRKLAIDNTLSKWESVKDRFLTKWLEINNGVRYITHSQANELAWKKQGYIEGGVHLTTLRRLIKDYLNQPIKEK